MKNHCIKDAIFSPGKYLASIDEVLSAEVENIKLGRRWDVNYDNFQKRILEAEYYRQKGYEKIAIAMGKTPYDLALEAASQLMVRNKMTSSDIQGLIYYDTSPWEEDLCYNLPCRLCDDLNIDQLKFRGYLTQKNCTSSVIAIETASCLLEARPDIENVLLVGGDCIATHRGEARVMNNEIFGDAGSALLVARSGFEIEYNHSRYFSFGWRRHNESVHNFQELSLKYPRWSLEEINKSLEVTGRRMDQIDYVLTNNPTLYRFLREKEGFGREKFSLYDKQVQKYGKMVNHTLVYGIEQTLTPSSDKSVLAHFTGLGANVSTLMYGLSQVIK